ncbi:MAG: DMT family transporter, partial [Bacteroidales bacterium]|nr:DMT family transporter [Bacteroidales bacterium]
THRRALYAPRPHGCEATFFYGLLTILPFLGRTGGSFSPAVLGQPVVYGNLLFLGLIASLACFIAWNLVMARLGNVTSTNYVYLNPIFTLITAMILLGERMTLVSGLGCAAILAGVILSGLKPWQAYRRAASFLSPSGSTGRSKRASGSEGCH